MSEPRVRASARWRVCHVITMLELGGAQQNTLHTVGHLDRARFAPALVTGPGGILEVDPRAYAFDECTQLVRDVRPAQDAAALAWMLRYFRRTRPHVVHTHSSKAGIVGRAAAALAGVPVIVHTVHGWGFHPAQPASTHRMFVALERLAERFTTRLVAVSRANATSGEEQGIAPAREFTIIRSGVALGAFRAAANNGRLRAELGLAPGTPLAGMIACLKPQKAPTDFVAVAARTLRDVPGAHFVLAGDGVMRAQVELDAREAGIAERFHLLGWRRDPEVVVGDLDVLVLTSIHEGLPRVVPEAMAARKAVVATAVDGTPEAVTDGVTGFLHAPHDVDGMAASLARLLGDPALAARCGAAGAARVGEWDIDAMVRRQEDLYEELLGAAGVPPTTAA